MSPSIHCSIYLERYNAIFCPGEVVSGTLQYRVTEPLPVKKITVSLNGRGELRRRENSYRRNNMFNTDKSKKTYVNVSKIIQEGDYIIPVGNYETNISFKLPEDVPPSFSASRESCCTTYKFNIRYQVVAKFNTTGWFNAAKTFEKNIIVLASITPKLPMNPVMHGQYSKLCSLFSNENNFVKIRANILNSVIKSGGNIKIQLEVENNTNITIDGARVELKEWTRYTAWDFCEDVPNCSSKTQSILKRDTLKVTLNIVLPTNCVSLENAELAERKYWVRIIVPLSIPHKNVVLDVPVQIADHFLVVDTPSEEATVNTSIGNNIV